MAPGPRGTARTKLAYAQPEHVVRLISTLGGNEHALALVGQRLREWGLKLPKRGRAAWLDGSGLELVGEHPSLRIRRVPVHVEPLPPALVPQGA